MNQQNPNHRELPNESSYRTGGTQPPEKKRNPLPLLLALIIVFGGFSTLLSFWNIHLFRAGQQDSYIGFTRETAAPANDRADNAWAQLGVTGMILSNFDRACYDLPPGFYITHVQPDSGAAAAGIRPGDVITAFDCQPVTDGEALKNAVLSHAPGDTVTVSIYRSGNNMTLSVTLDRAVAPTES